MPRFTFLRVMFVGGCVVTSGCASRHPAMSEPAAAERFEEAPPAMTASTEESVTAALAWVPGDGSFLAGVPRSSPGLEVTVVPNEAFVVGYSEGVDQPVWVCYQLFEVDADAEGWGRIARFSVDDRTEARVSHDDYTGTGYDRGHMAPSSGIGKRYSEDAWAATYLMSNIVPQSPGLNQRLWEAFERQESDYYAQQLGTIWVTTGPIFEGQCRNLRSTDTGETGIRVPSSCYKIIAAVTDAGDVEMLAIEMTQFDRDEAPIADFVTTVDAIEDKTGLDFFSGLPDEIEAQSESSPPSGIWKTSWVLVPSFPGTPRPLSVVPCAQ